MLRNAIYNFIHRKEIARKAKLRARIRLTCIALSIIIINTIFLHSKVQAISRETGKISNNYEEVNFEASKDFSITESLDKPSLEEEIKLNF